jgi:hypothetical protein
MSALLLAVAEQQESLITADQMVEIVLSLAQSHRLVVAVVQVISIAAILKLVVLVAVEQVRQQPPSALAQMEQQDKAIKAEM